MGAALSAGTGQLRFQTLGRIRLVLLLLLLLPVPGLPRAVTARHAAPASSTHSARGRASGPPAPAAPVPPAPVLRWCQRPSTTRHRLRREWWWTQRPDWRCCQPLRFVPQAAAAPSAAAPRTTKTCLIVHDLRSIRSAHMSLVEASHATCAWCATRAKDTQNDQVGRATKGCQTHERPVSNAPGAACITSFRHLSRPRWLGCSLRRPTFPGNARPIGASGGDLRNVHQSNLQHNRRGRLAGGIAPGDK